MQTGRCQTPVVRALDSLTWTACKTMPYKRIAESLLEIHCHMESFDVDFYDPAANEQIAAELEKLGAVVERHPHKSSLHVVCPGQAAEADAPPNDRNLESPY